jgi:hypothetical protein
MDLHKFKQALSNEEKNKLLNILIIDFLKTNKINNYTTVDEFCAFNDISISSRLRNILMTNKEYIGEYIDIIDIEKLKKCRNVGDKTIEEFTKLREHLLRKIIYENS